jgi:hypothetical protein
MAARAIAANPLRELLTLAASDRLRQPQDGWMDRCLMIGDAETDVQAGLAAGCRTIRLAPAGTSSQAGAVCPDLASAVSGLLGSCSNGGALQRSSAPTATRWRSVTSTGVGGPHRTGHTPSKLYRPGPAAPERSPALSVQGTARLAPRLRLPPGVATRPRTVAGEPNWPRSCDLGQFNRLGSGYFRRSLPCADGERRCSPEPRRRAPGADPRRSLSTQRSPCRRAHGWWSAPSGAWWEAAS